MKKVLIGILVILLSCAVLLATQPSYSGNHIEAHGGYNSPASSYSSGNLPSSATVGKYVIATWYSCPQAFCGGPSSGGSNEFVDSMSDGLGNTYNACGTPSAFGYPVGGPYSERWGTFSAKVTTGGTLNVTASNHFGSNTYVNSIVVHEVDLGVTGADPCDVGTDNGTYNVSTSPNTISTSTGLTASNEWIYCWALSEDTQSLAGGVITIATDVLTAGQNVRYGYLVASSTAAQTCTMTYSGTHGVEWNVMAFKAAAAGGSTPHNLSLLKVGK